jgi:HEAT repeat protein
MKHDPLAGFFLLVCAFVGLVSGCRSTSKSAASEDSQTKPYDPRMLQTNPPLPTGLFLSELDKSMRAWSNLTMTARTEEDRRNTRLLQQDLMRRTLPRRDELIHELESGPPKNRAIAASALGFVPQTEVQSPLLAALHDVEPDVVHNALLALALLEFPDTPQEPLCELFEHDTDSHIRANAGYALRSILEKGAKPSENLVRAARGALMDDEPLVRVQAALILGLSHDLESIRALGDLLYDKVPLASLSAAQSLLLLAQHDESKKGQIARALAEAFRRVDRPLRAGLQRTLVALSGHNYGDDEEPWLEWANRLP